MKILEVAGRVNVVLEEHNKNVTDLTKFILSYAYNDEVPSEEEYRKSLKTVRSRIQRQLNGTFDLQLDTILFLSEMFPDISLDWLIMGDKFHKMRNTTPVDDISKDDELAKLQRENIELQAKLDLMTQLMSQFMNK